jgi:hypothetical protein
LIDEVCCSDAPASKFFFFRAARAGARRNRQSSVENGRVARLAVGNCRRVAPTDLAR